jgi:predicted homoserine dehydrogenase-like protein
VRGSNSQFLAERAAAGAPVRVGLIGIGQMGAGIVSQCAFIPGIAITALADIDPARATRALARIGLPEPVVVSDASEGAQAIASGRVVVTQEAEMVPSLPIDVVVEATGVPEVGIRVGLAAALAKRHLVSMNVEADVTVGRLLRRLFGLAGAVYTIGAGDEPAVAWGLVDLCRTMGLEVIAAGKGKNNPLHPETTAADVREEAARKAMNPRMLAAFVDGTKTMCEMAALANATGMVIDVPGMHGPHADSSDLVSVFRPKEEGGVLSRTGVVDFVQGDVAPGVFVVVRAEQDVATDLEYLKVGSGSYFALLRPFHLANLEVPVSIVEAVKHHRPTLVAEHHMAEVGATAKRDLLPGQHISGIGGEEVYGFLWSAEDANDRSLVPLGLTEKATVAKHVTAGTPLTFDDVELDESSVLVRAWRIQQHLDTFPDSEGLWQALKS